MNIERPSDARAFLELAGPLLAGNEARNNLILGISGSLAVAPDRFPEQRYWVVTDNDDAVAAAMQTPPFNLLLATPRDGDALEALAGGIEGELPGVVGCHPEVEDFTRLWSASHPIEPHTLRNQGVYALERVQPVPPAPGGRRAATHADRDLLLAWMIAFGEEVLEESDPGRQEAAEGVDYRLRSGEGGFELWEDGGQVVSLSGWGGPTPNGLRVGPVYTPPELRGRGYATALVAGLSQTLLDGGRSFVFLYTDLANPTSNAIYERIGYVRVAESAMIEFRPSA